MKVKEIEDVGERSERGRDVAVAVRTSRVVVATTAVFARATGVRAGDALES